MSSIIIYNQVIELEQPSLVKPTRLDTVFSFQTETGEGLSISIPSLQRFTHNSPLCIARGEKELTMNTAGRENGSASEPDSG